MSSDEIDLSGVSTADVSSVLTRAADLLDEYGWHPTGAKPRLNVLRAITKACDEIGGPGVDSAELHMASLDAVCLNIFGKPCGTGVSVSKWERQLVEEAYTAAIDAQRWTIIDQLRQVAG